MKNITTPRTLVECSFTTGYPLIGMRQPRKPIPTWLALLIVLGIVALSFAAGVA